MRGKRGKILLDRLVVANIGQHRIEHRHFRAVGGNWDSRLRHQGQQAYRLEGYCFPSCIRAGDDELPALAFEFDADGNNGCAFELQITLEQRMAGVVQKKASCARGQGLLGQQPMRLSPHGSCWLSAPAQLTATQL